MGLIIVGAVLQTSAYTLAHLIIGRIITGLGTGSYFPFTIPDCTLTQSQGIDSSTVPMYQSELSKKDNRGQSEYGQSFADSH